MSNKSKNKRYRNRKSDKKLIANIKELIANSEADKDLIDSITNLVAISEADSEADRVLLSQIAELISKDNEFCDIEVDINSLSDECTCDCDCDDFDIDIDAMLEAIAEANIVIINVS